jgi:transcriptional regulator with XRE-family HTH domain
MWHTTEMTVSNAALLELQASFAHELAGQKGRLTPDRFLPVLQTIVKRLNTMLGVPGPQADFVEASVLQNSFPAFLLAQRGDPVAASQWVIHAWQDYAREAEQLTPARAWQALLDYDLAADAFLTAAAREDNGRHILRRLMTRLRLSQDEAGRMFGVSGETIRRWERGQVRIPEARMAELVTADAALLRLESLFLPDRLAAAIRRPADLFEGERALDLILRGRITNAVERYEIALAYQA